MGKKVALQIIIGFFLLYTFGGFLGVPYALKNIIPQKISDATNGGKFAVEKASFNPFAFRLTLQKLSFKTPHDGNFIAIEFFTININPLDYLWKGSLVVHDVRIDEPQISLAKDANGEMNFGWLGGEDENKTDEPPSKPLPLLIRDFTLKNGGIEYTDISEGKNYRERINAIGFHVENINLRETSNSKGLMRLCATINEGGFVDLRGKISSMKPFALKGSLAFNSGKLYTPWRYFKEKLPIEVADGTADLSLDYEFSTDDINATKLSNLQVGLKSLRVIPKGEKETLLTLGSLALENGTVWPMRKRFEAKGIRLDGMDVAASRGHDGTIDWVNYLDEINRAFPSDENETKEPWSYALGGVSVNHVNFTWSDDAPSSPYNLRAKNMAMEAGTVTSDETKLLMATFGLDGTVIARKSDKGVIADWAGISVDGISIDRANQFAKVANVQIRSPHFSLARTQDGKLDFERYMYQRKVIKAVEATPWNYLFGEIALENGNIKLVDEVPSQKVALNLDRLNVAVKDISSDPKHKNKVTLSTRINESGTLDIQSDVIKEPLSSQGSFALKGIDVTLFDPYLEPSTYASLNRGRVSVAGNYTYGTGKATVDGKLGLDDWVVVDTRDKSVLAGWESIGVTPFSYAYPDNRLKISQLGVNGLYANVVIDANKSLNLSTLSRGGKESNTTAQQEGNPFGLDIVKLTVHNGSANFSDFSLPLPFKTIIHDLEGEVLGISTTKDVTTFVKLGGGVDAYGMAKINGKLNTKAPKEFTDIKVNFDNLDLKQYTPYSLEFLGYKIARGKLYLNLGYRIDKGKLNSQNKVVIKEIVLGEEKAGGSPWPLGLVVALLEDSEGVIDIDLPIEGDVNNPDFKYGKVVWQVIGNLLTKAITSPFRLLGVMMGIESNDDSLSQVSFDAGEDVLLPPQREKLEKLTDLLIKRPKLTLKVHGGWASKEDERALKVQKLIHKMMGENVKKDAYSADALSLEMLEDTAKKSMDAKELKDLRKAMEAKYKEEAEFTHNYTAALVEKLISLQVLDSSELELLASKRSRAVVEYLHKNPVLQNRVSVSNSEKSTFDPKEGVVTHLALSVQ
jgi:hypothetical protein